MPRSQFACVTWDTVTFKAVRCCRSWCHDSLAEWHFSAQFKELTPTAQHCYNTSNTQVSCTVIIMFSYMQSYVGKLTLATGGAFPALFADAGEGVSSSYTSSTVGTRTGGACAILGCRKREKHQSKIREMHRIVKNRNGQYPINQIWQCFSNKQATTAFFFFWPCPTWNCSQKL